MEWRMAEIIRVIGLLEHEAVVARRMTEVRATVLKSRLKAGPKLCSRMRQRIDGRGKQFKLPERQKISFKISGVEIQGTRSRTQVPDGQLLVNVAEGAPI